MFEQLRNLDVQRPSLDELVFLSMLARGLRAEYEHATVDIPEWLDSRQRELKREISTRQQDAIDKRRSELKSRLEALKTPSEKRVELEAELARLNGETPA